MTRRERDTSESDPTNEALFDALVEADVLAVGDDGAVRTTDEFDDTHAIYHDSYVGVDESEFHEAVAATFGLPDADAAASLVAERDVGRDEFVCYLAVRSEIDADLPTDVLAAMAGMVYEVVPDSPIPAEVPDVTDDPESFVAGRDRAVVSVWKRFCDPCDALKAEFDRVISAVPDGVAVAGIDGEVAVEFCETHAVDSAPGFVLFEAGEAADDASESVQTVSGSDTDEVAERLQATYRG